MNMFSNLTHVQRMGFGVAAGLFAFAAVFVVAASVGTTSQPRFTASAFEPVRFSDYTVNLATTNPTVVKNACRGLRTELCGGVGTPGVLTDAKPVDTGLLVNTVVFYRYTYSMWHEDMGGTTMLIHAAPSICKPGVYVEPGSASNSTAELTLRGYTSLSLALEAGCGDPKNVHELGGFDFIVTSTGQVRSKQPLPDIGREVTSGKVLDTILDHLNGVDKA